MLHTTCCLDGLLSPCLPLSPFVSPCLPLSAFVSLHLCSKLGSPGRVAAALSPFVSLCLPLSPFCLPSSFCICAPHCARLDGLLLPCFPFSPLVMCSRLGSPGRGPAIAALLVWFGPPSYVLRLPGRVPPPVVSLCLALLPLVSPRIMCFRLGLPGRVAMWLLAPCLPLCRLVSLYVVQETQLGAHEVQGDKGRRQANPAWGTYEGTEQPRWANPA